MNEEKHIENKTKASFTISKYILNIVLPKCTIVHGEAVSSVYFQIALTVNNSETSKNWQKGKSWIGVKTISKVTGFNQRTVSIAIDILKQLKLLEQSYHGKLKMFELKNHQIADVEEMIKFSNYVEHQLMLNVPSKKKEFVKEKFNELNKKLKIFSAFHKKFLLGKIWINDINQIRLDLQKAESIYKGSSLFLINLMNQQNRFKKDEEVSDNIFISERDRSLMIGCSQSTLNRYIAAYENANFIKREKKNSLYQIKLNISDDSENKTTEGMVNEEMEDTKKIVCPICDREMKSVRSFNLHLSKIKDAQHYTLNELRRAKRTPDYEITMMLYQKHKEMIDSLKGVSKEEVTSNEPQFLKEEKEVIEKEFEKPKARKNKDDEECHGFENVASIKKAPQEDTAPGLLKYFYSLNEQRSPNWAKESKQIKILLTHKEQPLTPEQIRIVLRYMARKGNVDIRFLNTSVNEALLENKLLQDIDKEETPSYLVKYFYKGFNMEINLQTFVRDVQKIKETMNSGLNYEQTKIVIDYMIETNCKILNFIGSKRNDALSKYGSNNKGVNIANQGINNFNNNPSFFDQDFLNILKDEISGGRTRLSKVEDEYKEEAEKIAKELFIRRKFTTKFTGFEWAWRVGLQLDKRMYDLACKELHKQTYLDYAINSGKLRPDQEKSYIQLKQKYETWLEKQHDFFRSPGMMG